jgi:quercetin dioxygenase-like cupin family protein
LKRILRVYADVLGPKQAFAPAPAATPRAIYVREGDLTVRCGAQAATLAPNSAWHGIEPCALEAGARGAWIVRWELAPEESRGAPALLAHAVDLTDPGSYLMRCDRVDFPPGGIAYTHTHRGPGIRVLLAGALRVESAGEVHLVRPGGAWFESGPDPVLAVADEQEPTSFVRVMILPREIRGRPSIRYVKAEDQDKPKTQRYQVFCDEPIEP